MFTPEEIAARARAMQAALARHIAPTPLEERELDGRAVLLKREDRLPTGSFKLRGAFNAMRKVIPDHDLFVCASAGNHAQGVAFMCRHFDVHGVIFMPVTTPQQKVMKTKMFGGDNVEVRLIGDYFDQTLAQAKAFCEGEGAHFLSPFDDDDVIDDDDVVDDDDVISDE